MNDPRLLTSGLTGRHYIVTKYRDLGDGGIEAQVKYDVTADIEAIVAARLAGVRDLAEWLAEERDRLRQAYRDHNAGRDSNRPRMRPDLDTWANAYEVAERRLRAALDGPVDTTGGDDRG